ncbi:MAG: DNA polymerase-4 [Hyphomicrobiaceae bacterium]
MPAILHADMDAFFASVEQRDDPSLAGRPVVVGGSGRRGVIAAASYEARRFGVRSAMPSSRARRLCPDLIFAPARMARYAEVAAQLREIFYRTTPVVEPLSLDEAYLDVSGSLRLFGGMRAIAEKVRTEVRAELNLPISVGGGPGKLIAKIASKHSKPDGLLLIEEHEAIAFLHPLPIREIWGVGPATEERLLKLGITTIGQLAVADPEMLRRRLGTWGPLLHGFACGEDLRTVECDRGRRSYGEENTFPYDATDDELIEANIQAHAETVARRLRRDGRQASTVTLKFRPSGPGADFRLITRSRTLATPLDDGARITAVACQLWRAESQRPPLRLVGVQLSGLDGPRPVQLGLFDSPEDTERDDALNKALDDIVGRFGGKAIRRGAS